jgi:hypothetical protein
MMLFFFSPFSVLALKKYPRLGRIHEGRKSAGLGWAGLEKGSLAGLGPPRDECSIAMCQRDQRRGEGSCFLSLSLSQKEKEEEEGSCSSVPPLPLQLENLSKLVEP